MLFVDFLDYTGTFVFAISGALAAINKRMDPFGILILAFVTALGGGTLRDVLIGRVPVGWMHNLTYPTLVFFASIVTIIFHQKLSYFRRTLFLFDAIGLGLFTIIGVEIGLDYGIHPAICLILGTMSAAFGGVIRDILSNEIPLIFHSEVYASISLLGGMVFLLLNKTSIPIDFQYLVTSVLVVALRISAVKFHWSIPKIYNNTL